MKMLAILFLFLLVFPAFGQLTEEDLQTLKEELRIIVKEEITASEKRVEEYIALKIDAVNNKIDGLEKSLNARIDTVNNKINAVEKSLNSRIDAIRARIDAVEKSVNAPIDMINSRIDAKNTRIDALNMRIQDVNSHFYYVWIVIGAIITVLGFPRLVVYVNRMLGRESHVE